MILGDPTASASAGPHSALSLDALFRFAASRRPHALALADPPNRGSFTDGPPLRLTYAEADRIVAAIAARLRHMELPADGIIGVQMPNIAEHMLALLGVLRAGMIPALLPLLWRRADVVAALSRVSAKALITSHRCGAFDGAELALRVAADVFSIRYVCGFGAHLPDGVVPFGDLFMVAKPDPVPPLQRDNAAAHLAVLSFEVGQDGPVPVARRHLELLSGGVGVVLESGLQQDAVILSAVAPGSFAGLCLTVMPWLLTGGTLLLHHPFDASVFAQQCHDQPCAALVLPGPVALQSRQAGWLARDHAAAVLATWPAPQLLAQSAAWNGPGAILDVPIFGEAGFLACRRGEDGKPTPLPLGASRAPRQDGVTVVELAATEAGTVALSGPMVPRHMFPPGVEHFDQPHFAIRSDGVVDTGYRCAIDGATNTLTVTAPPDGLVTIGASRLPLRKISQTIARIGFGAAFAVTADPVLAQRLTGRADDRFAVQQELQLLGINPLAVAAFGAPAPRAPRAVLAAG
jgi:hypothetical protein